MVRKRVDADFCCDEHREKYHARTRRSIETLREADEHIAVRRRLNEGIPLRPSAGNKGKELSGLRRKPAEAPLLFGGMPTGLPVSRPILETHPPAASVLSFRSPRRAAAIPPPRTESARWSLACVQQGPRPPQPFTIAIRLPQGGPKKIQVGQAACDQPRRRRTGPSVELGAAARAIVRKLRRHVPGKMIGAMTRGVRPPAPVKPPPPAPPIVVTLRHPLLKIRLGGPERQPAVSIRLPEPGMVGIRFTPPPAEVRPPSAAYVRIVRRDLSIPAVRIAAGAMPRPGETKSHRFVPCPEGFRRRQYYNSEALDRFCRMGFQTIAGHRPAMRIAAAPDPARHLHLARAWAAPLQDPATAEPERRRPAPPFRENLCLPSGIAARTGSALRSALPGQVSMRTLDTHNRLPALRTWDAFAGSGLVRRQGALSGISPAHWTSGTAEALRIPAWAKPQTRGAKRTGCHLSIALRPPVFAGPPFAAGRRQAGPAPQKLLAPPVFVPAAARVRSQSVLTKRAVLLPASGRPRRGLGQMPVLASACQPPVGRISAASVVHPAHPILLPVALPHGHLRAAAARGLDSHPPAPQTGSSFDVAKGAPQMVARLALERFRRRGYEGMRSRHSAPHWPAPSAPRLLALAARPPRPHASRAPGREPAEPMFRACDAPAAAGLTRACTLIDWGTLAPAIPGSTDWGREAHLAGAAMPLPFMLPIDSLGPIRDWGLAPPPEPEKPPEPIHEDFAAGLANWVCANADWRQDIAGVRTGSLALLRPSLNMSDYELEFLGKIENQSIGWVVRAANTSNYHAVRVVADAASGTAQLVRFAVLAGEREEPETVPLAATLAQSSSCRVKMSVSGSEFKLYLNDKPAFEWSDDRLPEGGVGFFSEGDDRARLYWVKVTPFCEAPAEEMYPPMAPAHSEIHREIRMGV